MRLLFIALFSILTSTSYSQLVYDESYLDNDFWHFKAQLESAVFYQDTTVLKSLLADKVLEGHFVCETCTKEEFMKYFFSNGNAAYYWEQLQKVIRYGFRKVEEANSNYVVPHESVVFKAPSYLKELDESTELIILGERVNIREQPGINSPIIRQATYEKFSCNCSIDTETKSTHQTVDNQQWTEITLTDNQKGYVLSKYTSRRIYKRVTVAKIDGAWKIILFYNPPGC